MLILPHACFLHVPKTGGSWVKKAIKAAGISASEFSLAGYTHVGLSQCPCPEKFKFAFVRHPVSLYRSYWQFKMTTGWDARNELDMACHSQDFQEFIRKVLELYPGVYGRSLNDFVGEPGHEIEFVGRYENLVEDLIRALHLAGEQFDEAAIRNLPPYNVSDKKNAPAIYSPELEAAVRDAEKSVMERFGYK